MSRNPFVRAIQKFKARPGTYLLIPVVAAIVGWVTNWMAVQMIFYPVKFWGLPIYRRPEIPLGLIGWQGIVPCKTKPMSEAMVNMVTTQLLSVKEVFQRLNPRRVAELLAPEVPKMTEEILKDLPLPAMVRAIPGGVYNGLDAHTQDMLNALNFDFLRKLTIDMQARIDTVFNLESCVVNQMLQDRTLLGQLFKKCGQKELDFLTNSGLWFGFLLGIIQMIVALFWDNPWSLSIGGGIVGTATNWLALKWIFEPVNPTKVGPFILQGQFLRRQKEVAKEFSDFFANKILTSKQLWNSMLTDPVTSPAFESMFGDHFKRFLSSVSFGLMRYVPEPETAEFAARKAIERLPEHVGVLHEYIDSKLGLQESLRIKMELMSSAQFERVLHPIFEEDELTLILAGAALGFAAGYIQQLMETGQLQVGPIWNSFVKKVKGTPLGRILSGLKKALVASPVGTAGLKLKAAMKTATQRIRQKKEDSSDDEGIIESTVE